MDNLTTTTNNVPRELIAFFELPAEVRKDFDYIGPDEHYSPRFVKFKGEYYDVFDTQGIRVQTPGRFVGWDMCVDADSPLADWNAIISESFFSGVLFRFKGEDHVVVGRYVS